MQKGLRSPSAYCTSGLCTCFSWLHWGLDTQLNGNLQPDACAFLEIATSIHDVLQRKCAEGASVRRYACLEGPQAMHMKGTLVRQAAGSSYKLTEARLGGRLTRQDIHVVQVRVMHVVHVMHVMQMDGVACSRVVSCCR